MRKESREKLILRHVKEENYPIIDQYLAVKSIC